MSNQTAWEFKDGLDDDMRLDRITRHLEYDDLMTGGAPSNDAGVDPSTTFRRNGTVRYLLYPSVRDIPINTLGDVDQRNWQESGGETHCKSMFFYNERVSHAALPPNPPVVPGEVWNFSGSNSFSVDLVGAIISGGQNYDGTTTQSNADINITASNTFNLGAESSPIRHHLIYGCPGPTHPQDFKPDASRASASGTISIVRASNNQTLHSITIPSSSFGNRQLQFVPIQKILRENYPGLPVGEIIRVEYNMLSFGQGKPWTTCPDQSDSMMTLVGAIYGFAVLPLVRVS